MTKQIIHIYGPSGSGTSTIGRFLSKQLGYFFMDTDDYFWESTDPPYTIKREISDRLTLMQKDIESHDNVVISGSLVDWGDILIPSFTLAIRIETTMEIRMERLRKREYEKLGDRINPGGDMYAHHLEFMKWAAAYDNGDLNMRSKAKHDAWQKQLQCPLVELDGGLSVKNNFEIILKFIENRTEN